MPTGSDRPAVGELHVADHRALMYPGTGIPGVVKQDLVELGSHHLPGKSLLIGDVAEGQRPLLRPPDEVGAAFALESVPLHPFANAEQVKDGQAGRQDGFADVIARELLAFG